MYTRTYPLKTAGPFTNSVPTFSSSLLLESTWSESISGCTFTFTVGNGEPTDPYTGH